MKFYIANYMMERKRAIPFIYIPQCIQKVQKQRSFNIKVGVSVTYNEVLRARNDVAHFLYFQSKQEGVLIQTPFIIYVSSEKRLC